jgi:hypothetical protein
MNRRHKIFLTGMTALAASAAVGIGTFATFNAETDNPGNVFGHGTLVLSNTKQGGTACLSTAGGTTNTNVNANCDQLINATLKKPGDAATANLTLKNVGSIDASTFKVFSAACTAADVSSETYHGTGNPCGLLRFYIQQWTDGTFLIPSACVYGAATANTCNFSDGAKTLSAFQSSYGSSATALSIGSGLASNASGYFTIGVQSPSSADNSYQGRQGSFDLGWTIAQ